MKTKLLTVLAMALVVVLVSGCVAVLVVGAAAGAGGVAYVKGELQSSEAVAFDKAYDASLAAMTDMSYAIVDKQKDTVSAKITARGAGDKKITVALDKVSVSVTKITIRVGYWGDETLSRQILDKIKSHF